MDNRQRPGDDKAVTMTTLSAVPYVKFNTETKGLRIEYFFTHGTVED